MKSFGWRVSFFLFCLILTNCATSRNHSENKKNTSASIEEDNWVDDTSPEFNIPIVMNKNVRDFIRYFQTSNRKHFVRWLQRSEKYIPTMQKILDDNNLPTDLVYIAMIESGFSSSAYSRARAMGPWQFIKGTAKRYNLKMNWWIDERRDPIKSTIAASQYLQELYGMFDSWLLAAAGYNAGENKIKRAILKHNTEDFWEMTKYRYLRPETKQYIPGLIAAALIAKNPSKYGFYDIVYEDAFEFDLVTTEEPLDLRKVAMELDTTYEELRVLNPELLRWCTPPDTASYEFRIPRGKKDLFLTNYEKMKPKEKMLFYFHQIQTGDTLYRIARLYGTSIQPIIDMNNLKSTRILRPGQHLIIPVRAKLEDINT